MNNTKKMNNKGFSLVELIIVIAIMAVLIGILAPQYIGYVKRSKVSTDIQNAESFVTALNVAIADNETRQSGEKIVDSKSVADLATLLKLPAMVSKVDSTYVWEITYTVNGGVTEMKCGATGDTKKIWPDATDYRAANK